MRAARPGRDQRNALRGTALAAALSLSPAVVAAQDLEGEILDLLRARDCAMELGAVGEVFAVMGHPADAVAEAVEALLESGRAVTDGRRLALKAETCQPPAPARVPTVPWIEERLAQAPGCRRPLARLASEAAAAGILPEAFDRAVAALAALGRLAVADGEARLRPDLCLPGAERDRGLDRVLSLGRDSYRALLGLLAMERGCRLPLGDREGLVRELALVARERLFLGPGLSEDAARALSRRIGEALEDPGPAYRVEGEELVARYCLP